MDRTTFKDDSDNLYWSSLWGWGGVAYENHLQKLFTKFEKHTVFSKCGFCPKGLATWIFAGDVPFFLSEKNSDTLQEHMFSDKVTPKHGNYPTVWKVLINACVFAAKYINRITVLMSQMTRRESPFSVYSSLKY